MYKNINCVTEGQIDYLGVFSTEVITIFHCLQHKRYKKCWIYKYLEKVRHIPKVVIVLVHSSKNGVSLCAIWAGTVLVGYSTCAINMRRSLCDWFNIYVPSEAKYFWLGFLHARPLGMPSLWVTKFVNRSANGTQDQQHIKPRLFDYSLRRGIRRKTECHLR